MRTYLAEVSPYAIRSTDDGLTLRVEVPANSAKQAIRRIWDYIPNSVVLDLKCQPHQPAPVQPQDAPR